MNVFVVTAWNEKTGVDKVKVFITKIDAVKEWAKYKDKPWIYGGIDRCRVQ